MSVFLRVTNTKDATLTLMYRVRAEKGKASPVISIVLEGKRETLVEFESEAHLVAFKVQNTEFISNGAILLDADSDAVEPETEPEAETAPETEPEAEAEPETKKAKAKKAKKEESLFDEEQI